MALPELPRECKDVFARIYVEMSKIDPNIMTNQVNIEEGTMPIKLATRNLKPKLEVHIK